ncbi:MAG: hypothetical protein BGO49_17560 [Planctomycetales bacterium 71-10]|nr:MAG: hypothetical protein BGO49_17560 [Planctomycetales bacterium 71-10]
MIDARNQWAAALGLGIAWAGLTSSAVSAAPLRPYTSTTDARRAVVLDQDGRRIALPRAGGSLPDGTTPTYLAYRLPGRSNIPEGTPTVASAMGRGAVGPLRLDAMAIQSLNADLARSSQVAVVAPRQAFLVAKATDSALSDAAAATQYWRAAIEGQSGGKSVGDTLEGWYNSSTDAVKKFNDSIVDSLKKTFNPEAPKPVILGSTAAAQVLSLDDPQGAIAEQSVAAPQAAPVPEPSTWLVFAAASALGLRLRARKTS